MKLFPYLAATVAGAIGWRLGRLLDVFVASVLAIVATGLGFYYGRKYMKTLLD